MGVQRDDHIWPRKNKYRPTLRAVLPQLGLAAPKRTWSSPSPDVHSFGQQISCRADVKTRVKKEIWKKLACLGLNKTGHQNDVDSDSALVLASDKPTLGGKKRREIQVLLIKL